MIQVPDIAPFSPNHQRIQRPTRQKLIQQTYPQEMVHNRSQHLVKLLNQMSNSYESPVWHATRNGTFWFRSSEIRGPKIQCPTRKQHTQLCDDQFET